MAINGLILGSPIICLYEKTFNIHVCKYTVTRVYGPVAIYDSAYAEINKKAF